MNSTTGDEGGMAQCVGKIAEFDQSIETWQQYAKCLEHYFIANKIKEAKKKLIVLAAMSPQNYKLLRNLLSPPNRARSPFRKLWMFYRSITFHRPLALLSGIVSIHESEGKMNLSLLLLPSYLQSQNTPKPPPTVLSLWKERPPFQQVQVSSLAGQTLIIQAKEFGETHAKVVSHDGMLSCQSDSL